jgi:hypothetical protein
MKKLVLAAALVAASTGVAFAFGGPSTSDAHPPGAAFQSNPAGWNADGTPKSGPAADVHSWQRTGVSSSPVGLTGQPNTPRRTRHSR